jgi:tetratricopeptide (TPR) repeat protein
MEDWNDSPDLIDKVQELVDLGLFDEAIEMLNQYSDMFTDEWEIPFLYSRIYSEQNKPEKAIPYLHHGLKIDKTNVDCLLGLFYAYSMMNQTRKGGRYLLRAEKYHPDNDIVLATLIWYHTEMNNFTDAIKCFEKSRSLGVMNPETFRNAGIAFERIGDHSNAEKCFIAALQINPTYDEVRDMLADHYIFTGEFQKAIDLYKESLSRSPNNIRMMSRLVFCYSQGSHFDQAKIVAKEIIQRYPNSPVGYVDLAYVHLGGEDYAQAIECADKAIDIAPIDPEAFRVKGIAYSESNAFDNADSAFKKAIELDSENPEILRDYYHFLRKTGKFTEMETWVNKVIELEEPYCVEDYWFLADYYREKGLNTQAFNYLHKAYKNMPNEKELIPPMVDILLERDHTAYALSILRNYVEKKGWNEVMDEFARHSKLRSQWLQEGIRLLRFWSDRPSDYRKFIFKYYIVKFLLLAAVIILPATLLPVWLLFNTTGIIILSSIYALGTASFFGIMYYINRKRSIKIKETISEY